MLISLAPPPLQVHGLEEAGALCQPRSGMGDLGIGLDPWSSLFTSVLTPISNFFQAKEQSKTAKRAMALEASRLKTEKDQEARDFALARANAQADALVSPAEEKRKEQLVTLYAVGGVALVISAFFIMGAIKNKR